MMVESRNHRLLSFLCVSFGKAAKTLVLVLVLLRLLGFSGCLQVLGNPLLRRLWLLLSPTLFDRRAMTLPRQARSTPRLSRSLLFIIDRGWGDVYGYIGLFYGSSLGTSAWVRGTLQTRTIRG